MSVKAIGIDVGMDLLKAFGVEDTKYVKGFTLRCYADEAVTLTIERCISTMDCLYVKSAVDEYELIKKE